MNEEEDEEYFHIEESRPTGNGGRPPIIGAPPTPTPGPSSVTQNTTPAPTPPPSAFNPGPGSSGMPKVKRPR